MNSAAACLGPAYSRARSLFGASVSLRIERAAGMIVLFFVVFLSVLGLFRIIDPYPLHDWISLRLSLKGLGIVGPLAYLLLVAVLPLASPLSLLVITGSAGFGPLTGFSLSYIGALINANIAFHLVKSLSVEDMWGKRESIAGIKESIMKRGFYVVLLIDAASVVPYVVINSAAAASGIRWADFMKATSIGIIPSLALYSFVGETVVSCLLSPEAYFAFILVVIPAILFTALKKRNSHA